MAPGNKSIGQLTDTGRNAALLFALVGERLSQYYEYGQWPNEGPMRQLALGWLDRSRLRVESQALRALVAGSDDVAREVAVALFREVGMLTAHEMLESLDPNYQSEIGRAMMAQCVEWVGNVQNPVNGLLSGT